MSFSKQVILTHSKSQPSNAEELPNGRRSASSNIHCFPQYLPSLSTTYSFLDRNNLGFHAHHRFSNSNMPFKETQETLPLIAPTRTRLERVGLPRRTSKSVASQVQIAHAQGYHSNKKVPDPAPLRGKEGRGLGTSHVRV